VSEDDIVASMRQLWEVMKLMVEPSGAVSYAGVAAGRFPTRGRKIGIVLSGGNLDLDRLPWLSAS
jgi:threonine dehydratase